MKIKFGFLILIVLLFLSSCSLLKSTTEPKTDYEIFTELFNDAVSNFNNLDSYSLNESMRLDYKLGTTVAFSSIVSTESHIKDPLYMAATLVQSATGIQTNTFKVLALPDNDNYKIYLKQNNSLSSEEMTLEELEEETSNEELKISIENIPSTITKLTEETNDANQVLITYEYTFKLSELDVADRSLFDELLNFNFGSANRSPLINIDIKETIVINKTTKQLVEITYDITDFIEVAYNNFLQSLNINLTITDTTCTYSFKFNNLNSVVQNPTFISELSQ